MSMALPHLLRSPLARPASRAARALASVVIAALAAAAPAAARADSSNFELAGKIYNKWLWQNDDSRGCVSLGNPFWPDNIGGHNGVCSEFELSIKGRVSKYVTTGVRLQSRFGALWQNWWENGDIRWDFPTGNVFNENTSGESLGMNHAQYMKMRGPFIRIAAPIPTVKFIHVGASDLGMFNEWTIGKARYIDRDNGMGVFVEGEVDRRYLTYHFAAIALPKLFVGPRWNTGLRGSDPLARFWGNDWAYALKLRSQPLDDLTITAVANYVHDWEADRFDPDKTGQADVDRGADHAVNLDTRFAALNATLEAAYAPSALEYFNLSGLLAYSSNQPNTQYTANAVTSDQGFSPVLFTKDENGNYVPAQGLAARVRAELFDPLEVGLSFKAEYFNIGSEFNTIFGSRREADVLLTDGIISGGFVEGGQLPTLNIANEFVDFDEKWYESSIGWHGVTGLAEYIQGTLRSTLEYTYLGYNTNMQNRDIDTQYPSFLYTDGFTDINAYSADSDYANVYDRGRDPRSVYRRNQQRQTHIMVLKGDMLIADGLTARAKVKWVHDRDLRRTNVDDDYFGNLFLAHASIGYQVSNELSANAGYELNWWDEVKRSGSPERGYYDYMTVKHIGRVGVSYNFGGALFTYMLEYFNKDLDREVPGSFNQTWNVWRSKATLEASW